MTITILHIILIITFIDIMILSLSGWARLRICAARWLPTIFGLHTGAMPAERLAVETFLGARSGTLLQALREPNLELFVLLN